MEQSITHSLTHLKWQFKKGPLLLISLRISLFPFKGFIALGWSFYGYKTVQVHRRCLTKTGHFNLSGMSNNWDFPARQNLCFVVPETHQECIPGLHPSMSGMLRPLLWVVQVRSSGSKHWHSVPGHEQALLPDRTVLQAGPSAMPVTETGNGLASLWKNTDPAPGKREITVRTYVIVIRCMLLLDRSNKADANHKSPISPKCLLKRSYNPPPPKKNKQENNTNKQGE